MSSIYLKNGRYYIQYYSEGKRFQKPLIPHGHKNATTRKNVALALKRRMDLELSQQDDKPKPLGEMLDEWQAISALNSSKEQSKRNRKNLNKFFQHVGINDITIIQKRHVQKWMVHLSETLSNRTIKIKLSAVLSFLRWAEEHDIIDKAPRIKSPKTELLPPRYLNPEQYEQVLALAKEHDCYLEVFISLKTGVRLNELRLMEWEDFHWDQRLLIIPKTKSKKPRSIPLSKDIIKVLKPIQKRGLVFPSTKYVGQNRCRKPYTFINKLIGWNLLPGFLLPHECF